MAEPDALTQAVGSRCSTAAHAGSTFALPSHCSIEEHLVADPCVNSPVGRNQPQHGSEYMACCCHAAAAAVNCGGPVCPKCLTNRMCLVNNDCLSGSCVNGRCAEPPQCYNKVSKQQAAKACCAMPCRKSAVACSLLLWHNSMPRSVAK